jgi:hypothetical protein
MGIRGPDPEARSCTCSGLGDQEQGHLRAPGSGPWNKRIIGPTGPAHGSGLGDQELALQGLGPWRCLPTGTGTDPELRAPTRPSTALHLYHGPYAPAGPGRAGPGRGTRPNPGP